MLTDDELLALILTCSSNSSAEHRLIELLVKQQYFKRLRTIFLNYDLRGYESLQCELYLDGMLKKKVFVTDQFDIPLGWQQKLGDALNTKYLWKVDVYATPYERFELKEQELRLIREKGSSRFEYISLAKSERAKDMVRLLADRVKQSPRIEIFLHRDLEPASVEHITAACDILYKSANERSITEKTS